MWYRNSSGENEKPSATDTTSSRRWNYVRKDFVLVEATDDEPVHWEWNEMKILKEQYPVWLEEQKDRADIDYLLMLMGE